MTEAEIRAVVDKFADIAAVLHDADPGTCFRAAGCSALGYPAAGCAGQAGLPSVMSLGTYAQGAVLQKSTFVDAGRQSRPELIVLARDAQALPLMHVRAPAGS